jgi:hypothetical protein
MGNDPKQGDDFVKVPLPRESDDVEGHKQGIDSGDSDAFVKVPLPRDSDDLDGESEDSSGA